MTCSDEELAIRREKARELGMECTQQLAWPPGRRVFSYVGLRSLTVSMSNGHSHGPFGSVEEAVNMMILLGGGPK